MRTAPVPNIPAIPGMNPGLFVLGGGGGGGGSGAGRGKGKGKKQKAKGKNGGKDAGGGGKGACGVGKGDLNGGSCPKHHKGKKKKSGKGSKGDPVDVVTGHVFTVPVLDVDLPGPLPLRIERSYRSAAAERDIGLGFGWVHSFAWEIEVRRRSVIVHTDAGMALDFGPLQVGQAATGPDGMLLVREGKGFVLDTGEGTWLVFQVSHDERWLLSAVRDSFDNTLELRYSAGLLSEIEDGAGRVVRVRRARDGRIEAWVLNNARSQGRWVEMARFLHDEHGHLVEALDAEGARTLFSYDEDHFLTEQTLPQGLTFHYRYDAEQRCVETWGDRADGPDPSLADDVPALLADGETRAKGIYHCKLVFADDGYSEVIDSVTVHRYLGNEHGKLDKAISAGAVFERTYDGQGNLESYTDSLGATTTWKHDEMGRVIEETDPLGRSTVHERDPDGHIRRSTDPAGGTTVVRSLTGGIAWVDPIGARFESRFDHRGLTVENVGPNGGRTRYAYDDAGNLVEKTDALGAVTRWSFDVWGRCTAMTDPGGATVHYTYDGRGDLLSVRKPDGSVVRHQYDAARRRIATSDENGAVTRYVYGGVDKLCEIHEPGGGVERMFHDREGRLVRVVNARGERHDITLDTAGMVVAERTFDGRALSYKYDSEGRLAESVNGLGQKTEYTYDLAGQLVAQAFDDGRVERFEYDGRGDLVRAESPDGTFEYERNAVGWIVREKQTVEGQTVTVDIAYDLVGNVVERRTSLGHSERWDRDVMGQSQRVVLGGREEIRPAYDVLGREVARLLPGGGRIDIAYDERDRLARRRVSKAPAVGGGAGGPTWMPVPGPATVEQAYSYSPASELVAVDDRSRGSRRFEHHAGRLVASGRDEKDVQRYEYDVTGNVSERHGAPREHGPGDRLVRRGPTRYFWDDDARLVETRVDGRDGPGTRYQWGANGLLEAVERPDGVRVTFTYDPFARRVAKTVSRVDLAGRARVERSTRYVWDGDTLVHEITRSASERGDPVIEERTYTWDQRGFPLAHRDARTAGGQRTVSDFYHYLTDDIGTPERLLGPDGSVACDIERAAWGAFEVAPGAVTRTPIGFQGQYHDEETGLFYNRNRYYDPESGRYISADPVGLVSGFNAFAYAENQPTRFVDPLGLMATAEIWDQPGAPKKKKIKGYSDGQPRPPHDPTKEETDPAIQDAVDNAKKKFAETDEKGEKKDPKDPKDKLPNTAGKCAEVEALSKQAKEIRGELSKKPGWDKLSKDEQNAKVRNELREQFRNGAKIQAFDKKGKPIPPCTFCAQVMRELGIHPDNINADPNAKAKEKAGLPAQEKAKGGVYDNGKPWNGKKVFGGGSPSTGPSETPVVPKMKDDGTHQKQYNPSTGQKDGVYVPPENEK